MNAADLLDELQRKGIDLWADGEQLKYRAPKGVWTSETQELLKSNKLHLLKLLQQPRTCVASFAQQRFWYATQLDPDTAVYNIPIALKIEGPLKTAVLERSLNDIVRRQDTLRTTFAMRDGELVQIIAPFAPFKVPVEDICPLPREERCAEQQRLIDGEIDAPFDLGDGPLFRTKLVRLHKERHILLLTVHHIISDGWSVGILYRELQELYGAYAAGRSPTLTPLPFQYSDFTKSQRQWVQSSECHEQLGYWKQQLAGPLPALELPSDRPRPALKRYRGSRHVEHLSPKFVATLKSISQSEDCTLFVTTLAAFLALLHRLSGQTDMVVGVPIAGRTRPEVENLIGLFLNTLALRGDTSGNPTFGELLARVRAMTLNAHSNQDIPFELVLEALKPKRDPSRTPVFQVFFNMFNFSSHSIDLPELAVEQVLLPAQLSKFDLTLYVKEQRDGARVEWVYNTDLFDAPTIAGMASQYLQLLQRIAGDLDQRLSALNVMPSQERESQSRQVEVKSDKRFVRFDREATEQSIGDRFREQAERFAGNIAIKTKVHEWTYAQLDRTSDTVARSVLEACSTGEHRVALLFDHDAPMVAGVLGTLKSGKAYVALDPEYPRARMDTILGDADVRLILTDDANEALGMRLAGEGRSSLNIEQLPVDPSSDRLDFSVSKDAIAYILYTSGTTGNPKGVIQSHRNVLHHIMNYSNALRIGPDDKLTLLSSYSFDASVMDIFGALLNGATSYPLSLRSNPIGDLRQSLVNERITIYHSTPSVFRYVFANRPQDQTLEETRIVVLGGEEAQRSDFELYKRHFPADCTFINGLGPSESTLALQFLANHQTELTRSAVPVGFPVGDMEIALVDEAGVDNGVFGEIVIKGPQVALGYWRNAQATTAAFAVDPQTGLRSYRTGDVGRRLATGAIEFIGRKDGQLKIRGFRVEPGEIEAILLSHPEVRECVVVGREDRPGDKCLAAYVVVEPNSFSAADLRKYLKAQLPEYMVPSHFVTLDALPLTDHGKIDQRALPALSLEAIAREYVAPRTNVEEQLAQLWSKILGVETVGVHDNFFDLGGHSLHAIQLFGALQERLGHTIPLAVLLQAPTIAELGDVLGNETWQAALSSLVAIRTKGRNPPFFCVHGHGGSVLGFRDLALALGSDQPFYGLQAQDLDLRARRPKRFEDMAAHYIREIRTVQPRGPYHIGGFCLGGTVAYEMAQQLRAEGEEVALLAMIDSSHPDYPRYRPGTTGLEQAIYKLMRRIDLEMDYFVGEDGMDGLRAPFVRGRSLLKMLLANAESFAASRLGKFAENLPRSEAYRLKLLEKSNTMAYQMYKPKAYAGSMMLIRAAKQPFGIQPDPTLGWREIVAGNVNVHVVPGHRRWMLSKSRAHLVAERLLDWIGERSND